MGVHVFFLVLYVGLSGTSDAILLCSLLIAHCAINLFIDVFQRKRGLHVLTTFYVGVIIITSANFYYIDKINTYGMSDYYIYYYIVNKYIIDGVVLWAVGNTFIFIGYEWFSKKSFPAINIEITSKHVMGNIFKFVVFLCLLSLSGNAVNLSFITGGLQKILSLLTLMGILYFARLWVVEDNVKYRNYAIILCLLQTLIALYVSYLRLDLLTPTISFYGGYFIGKGKIKYVFSYRFVPLIIISGVFSMFFNTLGGNRAHFITSFTSEGDKKEVNTSYTDLSAKSRERGGVFERSSNIAQLTNVINLVEKNGLYNGRASLPLAAALIPRFLWPNKPNVQLGSWFALEIGAATISTSGRANNSINMTIPGELYLDFGWIGVILGCILFGGMLALFWNASKFNESVYNLPGALWGGYLLLYSLFGIGADLQIVITLISTYLMFLLIKKFLKQYEGALRGSVMAG